jgi:hypothetical protein
MTLTVTVTGTGGYLLFTTTATGQELPAEGSAQPLIDHNYNDDDNDHDNRVRVRSTRAWHCRWSWSNSVPSIP